MSKAVISVMTGLGGMVGWGTSDFLANSAADRVGNLRTFFWSQVVGVSFISILVFIFAPPFALTPFLFILLTISAVGYALGYLLFYRGLEIGNVSVVSSVVNVYNLFVIAIAYFVFGQRLTPLQVPALIMVLIGIILVSVNMRDLGKGKIELVKGVKETLLAAVFFGVFSWPIYEYVVERSDWISLQFLSKLIAIITVFFVALVTKQTLRLPGKIKSTVPIIAAVGLLEASAVLSVSYGLAFGDSIIVSPISSALTLITVGLAIVFLREKISKTQGLGIFLTICGIVLTAF